MACRLRHLQQRYTVNSPGFFYAMRRTFDGATKFGVSVQPYMRRRQIELERRHGNVSILWLFKADCMREIEMRVHKTLKRWIVEGEKEWFQVPDEYPSTLLDYLERGN